MAGRASIFCVATQKYLREEERIAGGRHHKDQPPHSFLRFRRLAVWLPLVILLVISATEHAKPGPEKYSVVHFCAPPGRTRRPLWPKGFCRAWPVRQPISPLLAKCQSALFTEGTISGRARRQSD